jgi:hypothetical protein
MSALNVLNITPQCSTCTMYVMFTDELFLGFETIYNTHYRALLWAGKVGIFCTIASARMLHHKYLYSRHFSESDQSVYYVSIYCCVSCTKSFFELSVFEYLGCFTSFPQYVNIMFGKCFIV